MASACRNKVNDISPKNTKNEGLKAVDKVGCGIIHGLFMAC